MQVSEQSIRDAFAKHRSVYHAKRDWSISHHVECWQRAHRAFDTGIESEFDALYETLRTQWQVFRGGTALPRRDCHTLLSGLPSAARRRSLSTLDDVALHETWEIVQRVSPIKTNKHGPSVVAISKFLHFWNPSMYVIVDDAIMWRRVLALGWLREEIASAALDAGRILSIKGSAHPSDSCDLLSYMGVLLWAGRIARSHPGLMPIFAAHIASACDETPDGVSVLQYEAAAVEWLLLGLAELPPRGVEID